jgi:tRNA threonylcarbamoyladenosine biosynthesis protein TsaB
MAQGSYRMDNQATRICAAFDARIGEIYWGNYRLHDGLMQSCTEESVSAPEAVYLPDDNEWLAIGSGWLAYPQMQQQLQQQLMDVRPDTAPLARDIIPLAKRDLANNKTIAATEAAPVYLRQKVAQTVEERQRPSTPGSGV